MHGSNIATKAPLRIAVAGAGAAGLFCALRLLDAGHEVVIADPAEPGRGALAASGGMLAGGFEAIAETAEDHALAEAFAGLADRAASLWAERAVRIGGSSDALGYERKGSLVPAFSAEQSERLAVLLDRARRLGVTARRLTAEEVAASEPGLAPTLGGLEFPGDGQVDNRALGPALADAVRLAGGDILKARVVKLQTFAGRVTGLALDDGREIGADLVVLATGADGIEGAPDTVRMVPVKGQMAAFAAGRPIAPNRIVRGFSIYLAAKPGGRLFAGATSEPGEASLDTDDAAIERLVEAARAVAPGLAAVPVLERWAGLRPMSADAMPVIGEAAPGLIAATGAYRNGVLLAPAIAEAVEAIARTGDAPDWAAPFSPARPALAAVVAHG
ncbi:MAG: FAD-dependent oxidoreductase [Oceanicaulis sp.]